MRLTKEMADDIYNLFQDMCLHTKSCESCVCRQGGTKNPKCLLNLHIIARALTQIIDSQQPSNEEKFKEIFGFPLYELHQLSAEEEREWREKFYQKNNTQMD